MIAWMYCVGEGRGSCEDATMSESLPVASLFCWFCKYEVHELVYFLTFQKNGIMFCFVLFCSFGNKSESFVIWMIHLFVFGTETLICQISALGWLVGGGMGGVNREATPRAAHVFFIFQIKKENSHFHFSDKIHIKRNFLKKGTKWQSLVNSRNCLCWERLVAGKSCKRRKLRGED